MRFRPWAIAALLSVASCGSGGAAQPDAAVLAAAGPCPDPAAASLGHSVPGKGIVFAGIDQKLTHIFAVNADGTALRQLTTGPLNEAVPQWSPDGTRIAFLREQPHTKGYMQIFVMNSDGSDVSRLTCEGSGDGRPAWSPDGSLIAFGRYGAGGDSIFVMKPDGSGVHAVFQPGGKPRAIDGVAWSPDGKRLAFADDTGIAVVNTDGTGFKQLTVSPLTDSPDTDPAWSPDGKSIGFSRSVILNSDEGADAQVWVMTSDGRNLHALAAVPRADLSAPSWSPRGNQLAFAFGDAQHLSFTIEVANSNGSGAHAIFGPVTTYVDSPNWSRTG